MDGDSVRWYPGLVYGVAAALAVYAAVAVLLVVQLLAISGGEITGRAFVLGLLGDFFAAHPGATDLRPGIRGAGAAPTVLYSLLGPFVLSLAGYGTARSAHGGSICLGYLPATLAGVVAVWLLNPPLAGFEPARAVLVAGVLAPVLFGTAGGLARDVRDGNA